MAAGAIKVRTLTARYVTGLLAIAVLLAAGQILIQWALTRQASDSRVVNLAGRQRMLSQRLSLELLALGSRDAALTGERGVRLGELQRVVDEWERAQRALQEGSAELGLPGDNSPRVQELFGAIAPAHEAMLSAAREVLSGRAEPGQPSSSSVVLEEGTVFLEGMDRIVAQYEQEAH